MSWRYYQLTDIHKNKFGIIVDDVSYSSKNIPTSRFQIDILYGEIISIIENNISIIGGELATEHYYGDLASDFKAHIGMLSTHTSSRIECELYGKIGINDSAHYRIGLTALNAPGGVWDDYAACCTAFIIKTTDDHYIACSPPTINGITGIMPYPSDPLEDYYYYNTLSDGSSYPTSDKLGVVSLIDTGGFNNNVSLTTLGAGDVTPFGDWLEKNIKPIDTKDPIPSPDDSHSKPTPGTGEYPDDSTDDEHKAPPSLNGTLYTCYHIGVADLISLSSFLWSKDFIDNLLKTNSNAIENIITLHWYPLTVTNGVSKNVILGNLDSKVGAYLIDEDDEVDYGSLTFSGPSGSYLDFSPYTKVQIHVPYCGFFNLNVDEIMNATLQLTEHINRITGAVSAFLFITRNGKRKMLYSYSGNCIINLPITGANYANMYLGLFSTAAKTALGAATVMATGGASAPVLATSMTVGASISGATDVMGAKPSIEHGGSFSAGSGYYDVAQAYLVCEYPNISKPDYWYNYQGKPYNQTVKLSSLSGFFIVEDINLEVSGATDTECAEIERILKTGAIK